MRAHPQDPLAEQLQVRSWLPLLCVLTAYGCSLTHVCRKITSFAPLYATPLSQLQELEVEDHAASLSGLQLMELVAAHPKLARIEVRVHFLRVCLVCSEPAP